MWTYQQQLEAALRRLGRIATERSGDTGFADDPRVAGVIDDLMQDEVVGDE